MVAKSLMYDGMIYIYALSLLFYFSDFVGKSQRAKQIGTGLLVLVWILQTGIFIIRMVKLEYISMITMYETLFFFSWLLVSLSLVLYYFFKFELILFFINVIAFAVLALNFFSDSSVTPIYTGWDIKNELLFIHVSLAIASYAAFSLGAVFAGMYIFLHRKLKEKQWSPTMRRLPSLDKIELFIFRATIVGMPLLISSLVLGIVWIILMGNLSMLFDPKVFNSFLIIAAYTFYLVQRASSQSAGNKLALWNLAAYAIILINFIVSNYVSQFHQWIWM
jgi:HemX protein